MRRFSSLILVMILLCSANAASAQVLQPNRPSHLIGVRQVSVWVSLSDSIPAALTRERLRQQSEQRIRSAGLEVVPVTVQGADSAAFVELNVVLADIRSASRRFGYAFWTSVRLRVGTSVLWERGQLSICEENDGARAVETAAGELLAEFLDDWRKANPKR